MAKPKRGGKPKGLKYRNLVKRVGVIYYRRLVNGHRINLSTRTADWSTAAAVRDAFERQKGIGRVAFAPEAMPTFGAFAARYLAEDTGHLAPTTRTDRKGHLAQDGPILPHLGPHRLDEISPATLRAWWAAEVEAPQRAKDGSEWYRSAKTGRRYLDAVAGVFAYAQDLGLVEASPVAAFRETLKRKNRTQRGRAESDSSRHVCPIERPEEVAALAGAAAEEGSVAELVVLLCLDAGLRLGEALGLRWGSVVWGSGEECAGRALIVREGRARGGDSGLTKSGRERRVALSQRLYRRLAAHSRASFRPGPAAFVLEGVDSSNFRKRDWRRVCNAAGVGHRALKDLRDTFASQLLSAGVSLAYVSAQLGHADVAITARHYARWIGGAEYREPPRLRPGQVPADLLAALGGDEVVTNWSQSPESPKSEAPETVAVPGA